MRLVHISKHQDTVVASMFERIERCVVRILEEYNKDPTTFAGDITRQEAAIMNIVRAVSAAQDLGQYLIREHKLGVPQSYYDVYVRIAKAGLISTEIADSLKEMTGFRETALRNDQDLKLADLEHLILHQLRFLLLFSTAVGKGKPEDVPLKISSTHSQ